MQKKSGMPGRTSPHTFKLKIIRPHQGDTMMKKLALFVGVEFV